MHLYLIRGFLCILDAGLLCCGVLCMFFEGWIAHNCSKLVWAAAETRGRSVGGRSGGTPLPRREGRRLLG